MTSPFALDRALERFPRFALRDLDEVRQHSSQVFCDHRLRLSGSAQGLDAQIFYRPLRRLGLGRLSYGAAVDIDPGELKDFYLLQIPISGYEQVVCDGQAVHTDSQCASLVSPIQRLQMHHAANTHKLFVRFEAAAFNQLARKELETDAPPRLLNALEWREPRLQSLRRLLYWLFEEASCGQLLDTPGIADHVEHSVMLALLHAAAQQPLLEAGRERVIRPGFVRRAIECIHERAQFPLSVEEIAEAGGVSKRSLYAGFKQYVGDTPLGYLKAVRLDRVHADLQLARSRGQTVSDVAMRWGFYHLGQFSADYRQRFGERPSETLAHGGRPV